MATIDIKSINVRFIHPTNNSDVEIKLLNNMLLQNAFDLLIDSGFIPEKYPKNCYRGIIKLKGELDNNKTVIANNIVNNDVIMIVARHDTICLYSHECQDHICSYWEKEMDSVNRKGLLMPSSEYYKRIEELCVHFIVLRQIMINDKLMRPENSDEAEAKHLAFANLYSQLNNAEYLKLTCLCHSSEFNA